MIIIYILLVIISIVVVIESDFWFVKIRKSEGVIVEKIFTPGYGYNSLKRWSRKPEFDSWRFVIKIGAQKGNFYVSPEILKKYNAGTKIICTYKVGRIRKKLRIKTLVV